jgi:hypothetical protein
MAATRLKQAHILCRKNGRAKINARNGPARSLARPVFINGHNKRRSADLFLQPTRDNANHTGMPPLSRHQHDGPIALPRDQRIRLLLNGRLNCAPFSIQAIQLFGNDPRLFGIAGRQQAHTQIRLSNASPGIDARAKRKAKV